MKHDELQQKLWEFVYDLLPDDEARAMADQITSDPEIARAYAEVKLQSDVVAEAMRAPAVDLQLRSPKHAEQPAAIGAVTPWRSSTKSAKRKQLSNWGNPLSAIAAGILVCVLGISLGGYGVLSYRATQLAARPLTRLTVLAPSQMTDTTTNALTIVTADAKTDAPVSQTVEVALHDPQQNVEVWKEQARTDQYGFAIVSVPEQYVRSGRELLVRTALADVQEAVRGPVDVRPAPTVAHLETDRSEYAPGDKIQADVRQLERLSGKVVDGNVEFEVRSPTSGETLERKVAASENGVAVADFDLPVDYREQSIRLEARSESGAPPAPAQLLAKVQRDELHVDWEFGRPYFKPGDPVVLDVQVHDATGSPAGSAEVAVDSVLNGRVMEERRMYLTTNESGAVKVGLPDAATANMQVQLHVLQGESVTSLAAPVPVTSNQAQLQFFPEGGQLITGVHNRVYFQALSAENAPVEVQGRLIDQDDRVVATFSTLRELAVGRGVFEITPDPNASYRVELDEPAGWNATGTLEPASREYFASLQAEEAVIDAHEIPQLRIASTKGPRQMVLAATCRGVEVGHTTFEAYGNGAPRSVMLPITQQAEGAIRVTLFDYSSPQPRALGQRLIYRQPQRRLHIEPQDSGALIAGTPHQFRFLVTSPQGTPTAATLKAALVAESPQAPQDSAPGLPADFWLVSEIEPPAAWDDVNSYVTGTPLANQHLEFLLGTQPWHRVDDSSTMLATTTNGTTSVTGGGLAATTTVAMVRPPKLFVNDEALSQRQTLIEERRLAAEQWIKFWGRIVMVTAVVILVLALLLAAMQRATVKFWASSLGFSAAAILLIVVFVGSEIFPPRGQPTVVMNAPAAPEADQSTRTVSVAPDAPAPPRAMPPETESIDDQMADKSASGTEAEPAASGPLALDSLPQPLDRSRALSFPREPSAAGGTESLTPYLRSADEAESGVESLSSAGGMASGDSPDAGLGGAPGLQPPGALADSAEEGLEQSSAQLGAGVEARGRFTQRLPEEDNVNLFYEHRWNDAYYKREALAEQSQPLPLPKHSVLLWEPLKTTDESGIATFEVTLPDQPIRYRLVVTAHNNDGLGEFRQEGFTVPGTEYFANIEDRLQRVSMGDQFADQSITIPDWTAERRNSAAPTRAARTAAEPATLAQNQHPPLVRQSFGLPLNEPQAANLFVTPAEYPLTKQLAGTFRGSEEVRFALPHCQPGMPAQVTVRLYPSLSAEILDAAAAAASTPVISASTWEALDQTQRWLNENNIPDVQVMRALNARLAARETTELAEAVAREQLAELAGLKELNSLSDVSNWERKLRQSALTWLRTRRSGDGTWPTDSERGLALRLLCSDDRRPVFTANALTVALVSREWTGQIGSPGGASEEMLFRETLIPDEQGEIAFSMHSSLSDPLPYAIRVDYVGTQPPVSDQAPLEISTTMDRSSLKVGERVLLNVVVTGEARPMAVIRVPIPAGTRLEDVPLPPGFGLLEGDLVFYLPSPFASPAEWVRDGKLEFHLPLIGTRAGTFTAPAARAHPEHAPDQISWAQPLRLTIE